MCVVLDNLWATHKTGCNTGTATSARKTAKFTIVALASCDSRAYGGKEGGGFDSGVSQKTDQHSLRKIPSLSLTAELRLEFRTETREALQHIANFINMLGQDTEYVIV